MQIVMNSMPNCPHCLRAKNKLKDKNILFNEIIYPTLTERNIFYDSLINEVSLYDPRVRRTMPKFFIYLDDDTRVIIPSADDMIQLIESGYFEDYMNAV